MKFNRICIKSYGDIVTRGQEYLTEEGPVPTRIVVLDPNPESECAWAILTEDLFAGAVPILDKDWEENYRMKCVQHNSLKEKMRLVEAVVDRIRYASFPAEHRSNFAKLLSMFDEESGNIKELQEL